jgi:hypothetical protein
VTYLYALAVEVASAAEYKILMLDGTKYVPRIRPDTQKEIALKSFGIPLLSGVLPKCPTSKGSVRKGLYLFLHSRHSKDRDTLNINLCKFDKTESLPKFMYGDPWGKGYDGEHRCVNFLVYASRQQRIDEGEILSYLKSTQDIWNENGLQKNKHNSDVYSDTEKLMINNYLRNIDGLLSIDDCKFGPSEALDGSFWKTIQQQQVKLKLYKTVIDSITNDRLSALYSNMNKNEKKQAKKTPLKSLIRKCDDANVLLQFNPTQLFKLYGLSQINHKWTMKSLNKFNNDSMKILSELSDKARCDSDFATMMESAIAEYSNMISTYCHEADVE